jgi:hypothetical protein
MTTLNPSSKQDQDWYKIVMVPLWKNQQRELIRAGVHYRWHLLALECLNRAKGPGGDPLKVAEFCAKWKWAMTLPIIGPTALIRKLGKSSGLLGELIAALKGVAGPGLQLPNMVHWGARTDALQALSSAWPQIAVFDITNSINIGIKLIAAMAPLIAKLQMNQAKLIAFDSKVVPSGDSGSVGQILDQAGMPKALLEAAKEIQKNYVKSWAALLVSAETMEQARLELGLPPDSM